MFGAAPAIHPFNCPGIGAGKAGMLQPGRPASGLRARDGHCASSAGQLAKAAKPGPVGSSHDILFAVLLCPHIIRRP